MAVYVDDAFVHADWGRWTGGGHLQADSFEELEAFARRLGLKPEWVQRRPNRPDRDHYDLHRAGRDAAILLGAIPETAREGVVRRQATRPDGGWSGRRGGGKDGGPARTGVTA